jgi:hypothetical protein
MDISKEKCPPLVDENFHFTRLSPNLLEAFAMAL